MNDNPLIQSLKEICLFLDSIETEYMLVGGIAVGIWSQPRATVDIDLLVTIRPADLETFMNELKKSNKFIFIHDAPMSFKKISLIRATLKGNPDIFVDFILADDDFKIEALKRREQVELADFTINITTPEDLIILKLLSDREQDRLDAKMILETQKGRLDLEYIRKWLNRLGVEIGGIKL